MNPHRVRSGEIETWVIHKLGILTGVQQILPETPLESLGLGSLAAVELSGELSRWLKIPLSPTLVWEYPTAAAIARHLSGTHVDQNRLMDGRDENVLDCEPDLANQNTPFPLSDIQKAYWVGRRPEMVMGNVGSHIYLEFDSEGIDLDRLGDAIQKLVDRHPMLRASVQEDGMQTVKPTRAFSIDDHDLRTCTPEIQALVLNEARSVLSHRVTRADEWPLISLSAYRVSDRRHRLMMSLDMLVLDLVSLQLFFKELHRAYEDPASVTEPLAVSFRDYLLSIRKLEEHDLYRRAKRYWRERILSLPTAPQVPLQKSPESVKVPRFKRRSVSLEPDISRKLQAMAKERAVTVSNALLTAYSLVLRFWSESPAFSVNVTLFNRFQIHPDVNQLIGDFTSVNVLGIDAALAGTFAEQAKAVQNRLWTDLEHRHYGGIDVMRDYHRHHETPVDQAMPYVFTSALPMDRSNAMSFDTSWMGEMVHGISQTPQVWLDHQVYELNGRIVINWDSVEELFREDMLDDMFRAYTALIDRLAHEDRAWETLPFLLPERQRRARNRLIAPQAPLATKPLHLFFEERAVLQPTHISIKDQYNSISYDYLFNKYSSFAQQLVEGGASPNRLIAVLLPKGWEQIQAVLSILKAGAAYLPIDPQLPHERIRHLLQQGNVTLAVTCSDLDARLPWPKDPAFRRLLIDECGALSTCQPSGPALDDLAYVIFTSGSTGVPKGVAVSHRGAANTIADINARFRVGRDDRILGVSALNFDLSVYDIFGILAAGGTLIIPDASRENDPAHLYERILTEKITIWNSVPAILQLVMDHIEENSLPLPPSLRLVMLSGDWIPITLPGRLRKLNPAVEIVSLGGATEASIWSVIHHIDRIDPEWKSIPYGHALANQTIRVLDDAFLERPDGVTGEIYIGGVGLAEGYWEDAERTAASFVYNPLTNERWYRTGDFGRYLPDGNIEFLGRRDGQVKLNGHRIELTEIEFHLGKCEKLKETAVIFRKEAGDRKGLVAFSVPSAGASPHESDLRSFLAERLPAYMIPQRFICLDALPKTPTGKIDRKALCDFQVDASRPLAPQDETLSATESILTGIVCQVTATQAVGRDDHFYDLGIDSLKATKIASHLRESLKRAIPLRFLFEQPTIRQLARALDEAHSS